MHYREEESQGGRTSRVKTGLSRTASAATETVEA